MLAVNKMQIAIDGPAGSGKSTAARRVAQALGYAHIDTGVLYRAVALIALRQEVDFKDNKTLALLAELPDLEVKLKSNGSPVYFIAGEDVSAELRSPDVNRKVSQVAKIPAVRSKVTHKLKDLGRQGGIVMDGRDIGTVVLPAADVKIFLTADLATRVARRQQELSNKGFSLSVSAVENEMLQRDREDSGRQIAPLKPAPDAYILDTSDLTAEEVVQKIISLVKQREQKYKT